MYKCWFPSSPRQKIQNTVNGDRLFLKQGVGMGAPQPPMASPCAAPTRAAFQHSNEEIRAGGNMQYSRQWRVALESINYDNTWYYQSHCSLAEKWGTVESFTIYVLWMTVRIYQTNTSPKNLKEKKSSTKPYTKIHC